MDLLTTAQAAALLGLSDVSTVRHLIRDGHLKATKAGRDWLIERRALEDYERRRRRRRPPAIDQ
jgi:excisionase family DNA binding protein